MHLGERQADDPSRASMARSCQDLSPSGPISLMETCFLDVMMDRLGRREFQISVVWVRCALEIDEGSRGQLKKTDERHPEMIYSTLIF